MCLAIPGKIVQIQGEHLLRTGTVSFGEITKDHVSLALVDQAQVGDYVYVHAGVAIGKVHAQTVDKIFNDYVEGTHH